MLAKEAEPSFMKAKVTLDNDGIKALPSGQVVLEINPGVGKMIAAITAVVSLQWAADYTNIDANCVIFVYPSGGQGSMLPAFEEAVNGDVTGLLAAGESRIGILQQPVTTNGGIPVSTTNSDFRYTNQSYVIECFNGAAGNFTGGDAANKLTVTLIFETVDTE